MLPLSNSHQLACLLTLISSVTYIQVFTACDFGIGRNIMTLFSNTFFFVKINGLLVCVSAQSRRRL